MLCYRQDPGAEVRHGEGDKIASELSALLVITNDMVIALPWGTRRPTV